MKKSIIILFAILAFAGTNAKADTLRVETKIKEVTVYLRGAQVAREGKISVPKGVSNIVLHNLTPSIEQNSIQIQSKQNITMLGVVYQKNYFQNPKKTTEVSKLEQKSLEINEKIQYETNILQVYKQEEQMILYNKS